jgi:hypothetical protein
MGKCLLKASKEFSENHKNLLILFNDRADKFNYIKADGTKKKFVGKKVKKQLPPELGVGKNKPKSPAGNKVGKVKPFVQRYKRDKSGKIIMKQRGTVASGEKIEGVKGKAPIIEKINTLPDKITKQKSKIRKKIDKENAKIANLTANEAEKARVTIIQKKKEKGKISNKQLTRRNADMDIKSSEKFAKDQGVVLAQTDDPKKIQKPPKLPTKVGKHNLRESKLRERKELDKDMKTRARKKNLGDLSSDQAEKMIQQTMRRKNLNRRGALTFLRKNPLFRVFLRK